MKKNTENVKSSLVKKLTLIFVAYMVASTVAICWGQYCYPECVPSMTVAPAIDPVCNATAVEVGAITYCDDEGDTVTVNGSGNVLASDGYTEDDGIIWYGAVPLVAGLNSLNGAAKACGSTAQSSVVCVPNAGTAWHYSVFSPLNNMCGNNISIAVYCLQDGAYKGWETHTDMSQDTCISVNFTEPNGQPFTSSGGLLIIPDQIGFGCPSYNTDPCSSSYTKTWNLYDPVSLSLVSPGVQEAISVSKTKTSLTITESGPLSYTYTYP